MSLSYFQFAEKFQEVKEAAKLAKDKSQEKVETLSNHSQVNYISLLSEILIQYNTSAVQLSLSNYSHSLYRGERIKWNISVQPIFCHKRWRLQILCLEMASSIQIVKLKYL